MNSYTIVITPDSPEKHTPNTPPQTTIRVDTSSGEPRITEVTIRSTTQDGLSVGAASVIDLELLVRALITGTRTTNLTSTAVAAEGASPGTHNTTKELDDPGPAPTGEKSISRSARKYRRMPEAAEVLAAYERIGTVTGMAKHFGVPRHTAQSWMTRIRGQSG